MTQRNAAALAVANEVAPVAGRIKDNVEKVLVGKGGVIELTLAALLSGGHILIDDVPGIGKTTLARSLASSLDCSFKRIQFTTDLMPSDITGINYYNQRSGDFEFRAGPIIAQVVPGRRDQPRHSSHPVRFAGSYGRTPVDRGRGYHSFAISVLGDRHPEPH